MKKTASGTSGFFQLKEVGVDLRRAIRVAAAIDDMTMEQWVMFAIRKQLDKQGIVIEGEG